MAGKFGCGEMVSGTYTYGASPTPEPSASAGPSDGQGQTCPANTPSSGSSSSRGVLLLVVRKVAPPSISWFDFLRPAW